MKLALKLAGLVLLTSTAAFGAGTWQGYLVDSRRYESEEQNVNPNYTLGSVGRDKDLELKLCVPTEKTKSFGLVQQDWRIITFGPDGNAKATELIRKAGKKQVYLVTVTGEMGKKRILKVNTIAPIDSLSPAQKSKSK